MQENIESLDFSTILASSIHDMKNSLGMLLNKIDDMSFSGERQASETDFDQLKYQGKRVNDHLIQLLVLYRIDQSQYFANINEVEIDDFLKESVEMHIPMLQHQDIDLQIECKPGLYWYIDRDLMDGVITNIVNNLYVYAKSKVHIVAGMKDKQLFIQIKDDGPGYPEEMLISSGDKPKDFNFKTGSTGLGLHFASTAARMHKNKDKTGYISTTNDGINGGGCFSIAIP